MTLALTVPILGFVFFGWTGWAVGLLIAAVFSGSAFRSNA